MKKYTAKAFTLAEVLITLAIIGIVASITIRSMTLGNQKTEMAARFAKSYSTIMNAVNLSVAQNGPIETWGWEDAPSEEKKVAFMKTYFLPYLNVAKFCPDASTKGCFGKDKYKRLDNSSWQIIDDTPLQKVLLADGSSMLFYIRNNCLRNNNPCLSLYIDVNGAKKPNTIGIDTFNFVFYPTGEFLPNGVLATYDKTTNTYERNSIEYIRSNCQKGVSTGMTCGALIIMDGFKINYL